MRKRIVLVACAVALSAAAGNALADDGQQYFIAMRTPQVDPAPRFAVAMQSASGDQTVAYTACDGQTYYLSAGDMATVNAAIASQSTIELHTAAPGVAPQDSAALCLIQASP
jgi:hypothetical protein